MKPAVSLACVIFLSAIATRPAFARNKRTQDVEREVIKALIQRAAEANNAGDVEGWVSLFARDAVYMVPGAPSITSREGLIEIAKAGFRNQASVNIRPVEIQVYGDWAFARTHVSGSIKLHDTGEVVPVDVKEIAIFSRQPNGDWKIARLINNRNTE